MRSLALALVVGTMLGIPSIVDAQQDPQVPPASPVATPTPEIDVTKLGVDLSRIQKGLAQATEEERRSADGLRIDYRVNVFGRAPAIDLFETFDPVQGPVPFGAPTHKDFLYMVTPQEFRAPAANFSNLAFWAIQKLSERSTKSKCEEEIARYKADVMAGVPVAAPTCAR